MCIRDSYLTIEKFFRDYSDRDGERWELVAGVPVMSPTETPANRATVFTVGFLLRTQLGAGSVSYTHLDVYKRQVC